MLANLADCYAASSRAQSGDTTLINRAANPFLFAETSVLYVGLKIISWFKKWLFALSMSIALLLFFAVWLPEALGWLFYLKDQFLPAETIRTLTLAVAILFIIALAMIAIRPVPPDRWSGRLHYALLFITAAFNVTYWLLVFILMMGRGYT
ncbi:MAG: hypothetical protein LUO85_04210 [Methanomassiliicoccales archaeon]|nr:hypothetical protein [Methanomassiliicoccales archaeon]